MLSALSNLLDSGLRRNSPSDCDLEKKKKATLLKVTVTVVLNFVQQVALMDNFYLIADFT